MVGEGGETKLPVDEWVQERREEALRIVGGIFSAMEYLRSLPENADEARKLVAVNQIDDLLPVASQLAPAGMTKDQVYAAMLVGRGLTWKEAAQALGVPGGEALLHEWNVSNRDFRRVVRYWRRVTLEEQLGLLLREIDAVAASTGSESIKIKLARLRWELSKHPGEQELQTYKLALEERMVVAREAEVSQGEQRPTRPAWLDDVQPYDGEVFDAEFTVEVEGKPEGTA